ncbi:hypothetical protein DL95DRAFT_446595 [Leptodontidium sp. 2 PMI_412]|nr:hypothetical protein DL95DRAFT_446595 [Leptodontidium sp. 2 PMI_412]
MHSKAYVWNLKKNSQSFSQQTEIGSQFVFIATPGSSLSDLHTDEEAPATLNSPVDEVNSREAICEEPIYEEPVCGEPAYDETVCQEIVIEEPQPIADEDDGRGFYAGKKGKKDKKGKKGKKEGRKAVEEVIEESIPEPEPVPSPAYDPEPEKSIPEPEPVPSPACDPEPEAAVEQDSWLTWGISPKKDKEEEMRSTVPGDGAGAQNVQEESEMGLEVTQLAPLLAASIPTPTAPRSGQTVVFTIRHSNGINKTRTLEVMLFLADTTYAAICGAIFAYLDSQEGFVPSKRTIQIRSGIDRNGKVDLSAVEESMWPVYIEYFCQYTKLPELTVDVLDS